MAATVVDQLIVTLGLDPSGYKKGATEANKATQATSKSVKDSSEAMVKALTEVGRSVAVMFLGFEGISGLGKFLAGLNAANARLGNVSANLGLSVHAVDSWGQALKLVGGTTEEAQGALRNLSQQITLFQTKGEHSPLIDMMLRYGIALTDANGKTRSTIDLLTDLGNRTDGLGRRNKANLLAQAGLSENVINLLSMERGERDRILLQGEQNARVTDAEVAAAFRLEQAWVAMKEKIEAVGQSILTQIIPPLIQMLSVFEKIDSRDFDLGASFKLFASIFTFIKDVVFQIGDGIGAAAAAIGALLHGDFRGAANIIAERFKTILAAPGKLGGELFELWNPYDPNKTGKGHYSPPPSDVRNNNPGNLRAFAPGQAVDSRGIRIFASLEEGTEALRKQIALDVGTRGMNIEQLVNKYAPAADNNDVPAYIAALVKSTGKGARDRLSTTDQEAIIRGIVAHEGAANAAGRAKVGALLNPNPNALLAERGAVASPSAVAAAQAGSRTVTNTATVENMTVVTQATDANGIAASLPGAIARKGLIAQADTGMTS